MKTTYHPFVVRFVVGRTPTFEILPLNSLCLLPVASATSNSARTFLRISVPLFNLSPSLDHRPLRLGTPTAAAGVVVRPVLVSYLPSALPSSELSAFLVP